VQVTRDHTTNLRSAGLMATYFSLDSRNSHVRRVSIRDEPRCTYSEMRQLEMCHVVLQNTAFDTMHLVSIAERSGEEPLNISHAWPV